MATGNQRIADSSAAPAPSPKAMAYATIGGLPLVDLPHRARSGTPLGEALGSDPVMFNLEQAVDRHQSLLRTT